MIMRLRSDAGSVKRSFQESIISRDIAAYISKKGAFPAPFAGNLSVAGEHLELVAPTYTQAELLC